MNKLYRVLGKRGRITIPYEIRRRVGFQYNDVLSFTEQDGRTVVVRREKICDNCQGTQPAVKKQADGITLTPLSGHRRISTQKTNFENKIQKYVNQGYSKAEATQMAAKIILPPGTSEHNAGIAMDIISLDVEFEQTQAFRWLQENAADYGFILRYPKDKQGITEITYEPWHWRYVGVENAKKIKASGQCLEEYLGVR